MRRFGYGYGYPLTRSSDISIEAKAWQASIIANGGTITPTQLAFMDKWFFKASIIEGNILNEAARLNVYCCLAGSEMAARTCMIRTNTKVDPINSPTFDNNGYRSQGTGYLNLNFNASTGGGKFGVTNNMFGAIVKIDEYASGTRATIGANVGPDNCFIDRSTGGVITFVNNSNTLATDSSAPTGNVLLATKKTTGTAGTIIINGTETAVTFSSRGAINLSVFELSRNFNGTPNANFDIKPHLCSFHASANFNWSGFRTVMNNLIAAAGL
jgi:hypothetical protein